MFVSHIIFFIFPTHFRLFGYSFYLALASHTLLYFASSNQGINPTGLVFMLKHLGHGCGADKEVAFHSMSGAENFSPQSRQINCFFPLSIRFFFLQQNKYRGAQKHRASIAISKRKAQTSITHSSKNRGPEITYTIKKNEMTVQSTPIDEDRLLASLRL